MSVYNVKSKNAQEFINHQEILDTLEYAEQNKRNAALIDSILEKARPKVDKMGAHNTALTHREAAVLLACDLEDKNQEIFRLANEIKKTFYGNRIVIFAPLYLSNYCVNGCVYCPYHLKNKCIPRKKLTQEEIRQEVIALQDKMGWYGKDRVAIYRDKWEEICHILADCPSSDEMLSLCEQVGLDISVFETLYGEAKISDALLYAKDLKDRYTVLWTYYDLMA